MNSGLESTSHASMEYYDSDYPSSHYCMYAENFDDTVELQGLAYDTQKYLSLAEEFSGSVLELCCGTGRVLLPLAEAGFDVTGVDFCQPLLDQLVSKLELYRKPGYGSVQLVRQDITALSLEKNDFDLAICAFNSLLCITDFESQQKAIFSMSKHLRPGGLLALDVMNPFVLNWAGDADPKPFFTRRHPSSGNTYTRFAAAGPLEADQRQRLFGWYDEIQKDHSVKRKTYSMYWRPVFQYELRLMLEKAGFHIRAIYGGHRNEPFVASSRKMFVEAVKA